MGFRGLGFRGLGFRGLGFRWRQKVDSQILGRCRRHAEGKTLATQS